MKCAFVFPGQGSQSVGMMAGYESLPVVRDTFTEASDILGQDFWSMANDGPAEEQNLTVNTQPLMLMGGVAVYRAWQSLGGATPEILAGHSLGEYTALVIAGALDFHDALMLVRYRAQVMQEAVPEGTGAMAAILGLDDATLTAICQAVTAANKTESLEPANFNSPGQIVIAGHKNAVFKGIELAKEKGAKRAIMLPMSIPSHCRLMQPAAEKMRERLAATTLQKPAIAVLHNVDVASHDSLDAIREILARQLFSPVRWVDTIHKLAAEGVTHNVECGPGNILTGLNKRIERGLQHVSLSSGEAIQQAASTLR